MKNKKLPKHCKGCRKMNRGSFNLSKYRFWCCHFSTSCNKAKSICKLQKYKENLERDKLYQLLIKD